MGNRILKDTSGTALLEFILVFPLVMLVVLGSVDASLLMLDMAQVNKATLAGARTAVISDPVIGSTTWSYDALAVPGDACYNDANGTVTGKCQTAINMRCTATAGGPSGATAGECCTVSGSACASATAWSSAGLASFNAIFRSMTRAYPEGSLDARQVQIGYKTTGLGYVKQPGGQPLNVTVSVRCMSHRFFFLNGLMSWVFSELPSDCPSDLRTKAGSSGPIMPATSTTLPGEDLDSTNN